MAINLPDLRTAVANYLNTRVTCSVTSFAPAVPTALSPGERFTFSVQARNAPAPDGIALRNVLYHVRVMNPSVARLIVPSRSAVGGIAYRDRGTMERLSEGAEVTEYYLSLSDRARDTRLDVGESDTVNNRGGRALMLGAFDIRVSVLADPNLDFLFPKREDSREASRSVTVV